MNPGIYCTLLKPYSTDCVETKMYSESSESGIKKQVEEEHPKLQELAKNNRCRTEKHHERLLWLGGLDTITKTPDSKRFFKLNKDWCSLQYCSYVRSYQLISALN